MSTGTERRGRETEFFPSDMIEAIASTRTVAEAARALGCSAELIHVRARSHGALQQAVRDQAREREKDIAVALLQNNGVISKAGKALGMDPQALRYHVSSSKRLREIYLESREGLVDTAEENVFAAVEKGNLGYSWKILQTLGKNRGYTERRELEAVHVHVQAASTSRLVELLDQHAENDPDGVAGVISQLDNTDRTLLGRALQRHAELVEGELVSVESDSTQSLYQNVTELSEAP